MSGSLGASLWNERPESVDSRASIQAIGANVDRESVVPITISPKIITALTRYRPIVLEFFKNCNACNFTRRRFFGINLKLCNKK